MPKSYYQSINQFMACDGSYAIVNKICNLIGIGIVLTCLELYLVGSCRYALVMQAPAYCSCCYYVGSLHVGSLHPLGIWLRDLCIMCPP